MDRNNNYNWEYYENDEIQAHRGGDILIRYGRNELLNLEPVPDVLPPNVILDPPIYFFGLGNRIMPPNLREVQELELFPRQILLAERRIPHSTPVIPKPEPFSPNMINIIITKVVSPSKFWFQPTRTKDALKELEHHMQLFYEDDNYSDLRNPKSYIKEGISNGGYYAVYSRSKRQWVRCRCFSDVPEMNMTTYVTMSLVDYGSLETVPANYARPLQESFCKLAAQGYQAALLCQPVENWTIQACRNFRETVLGKSYYGIVLKYKYTSTTDKFPTALLVLGHSPTSLKLMVGFSEENGIIEIERSQIPLNI